MASRFDVTAVHRKNPFFRCACLVDPGCFGPVHRRAVHPAIVASFERIEQVVVIIQLGHFVAREDQGNAFHKKDHPVQHLQAFDGQVNFDGIGFHQRFLQTRQCSGSAGSTCFAGLAIALKNITFGITLGKYARIKIGTKIAGSPATLTHRSRIFIRNTPTNVIVATDVVDPGGFFRNGRELRQSIAQQLRILRSQGMPEVVHHGGIVADFTGFAFQPAATEVTNDVVWGYNGFGFEQHAWRYHPY